jgi:hypothetical protein
LGRRRGWWGKPWRCGRLACSFRGKPRLNLIWRRNNRLCFGFCAKSIRSAAALGIDVATWSNQQAQSLSNLPWNIEVSRTMLKGLAGTSDSFFNKEDSAREKEFRAERLVLGLDRLFKGLNGIAAAPGNTELAALFDAVQDRNQFDPQVFATRLQKFADAIK